MRSPRGPAIELRAGVTRKRSLFKQPARHVCPGIHSVVCVPFDRDREKHGMQLTKKTRRMIDAAGAALSVLALALLLAT